MKLSELKNHLKGIVRGSKKIHDAAALTQLQPLVRNYIPLSAMAMSPAEICKICNDLVVNRRKCIVEFGSGASTVYEAKVMDPDARLYTVDHDSDWLQLVGEWLEKENLRERVILIHAPLENYNSPDHNGQWYSLSALNDNLPSDGVDCVVVDGPPAGIDAMARFPAVPYMQSRLSKNCSIYLDDIVRKGEKQIAERWGSILGVKFRQNLIIGGYASALLGQGYMD